jgi:hypothetical protein
MCSCSTLLFALWFLLNMALSDFCGTQCASVIKPLVVFRFAWPQVFTHLRTLLSFISTHKGSEALKQFINHVMGVKDAVWLVLLSLLVNNKTCLPRPTDNVSFHL